MKPKFIEYFMNVAEETAKLSPAKRLQCGAVVVRDNRAIATGYNGTPMGWYTNECEDENGVTKPEVVHAEQNAICQLASSTESSKGADIFITHSPCPTCAILLFQSGIKRVFYRKEYRIPTGLDMLRRLNIEVVKCE